MSLDPTIIAIPVYFLLIGLELVAHRFQSIRSYRLNDAITNINCGVTSQVTGAFLKVFTIGFYTFIFETFRFITIENSVLTWIVAFIAYDFFYYWAHRMSHEVNLFWGGHSVHHQSEEYNLSVALRQSSTQTIWTFIFYTPMALVGFHPLILLSVSGFNLLYQFWIHTESINKLPQWFEAIFNTPSHHRVHHARNPKYIDKNHGGTFIIWDRLFGTFKQEEERPTYGITKNLNSWNPVWANVAHYSDMLRDMRTIPKWSDRLRYVFQKPGWLPDYLGGYRAPYDIDRTSYRKFDLHAAKVVNAYVLVQYIVLLAGTALFLFNLETFENQMIQKLVLALIIIVSTVSFGAMFEGRKWVSWLEIFRLVAIPTSLLVLFPHILDHTILSASLATYIFGTAIWFFAIKKAIVQPTNS
ncbi:sterol desaturase family protein [Roseivirga sp. UBA838]|uniref:sterol desaturase family protein n=1 Tax=Roseivirga sp. UBA838 TaxID=1947393 RepID=UPI00257C36F4|nr:sterol desaturase family protein [Roseivirga sp. UBA838]|tara:strand:+ start:78437 stop:79675 length:1239 start_codon:yes stop_codon:yes gene_type:complete